MEGRGQDRVPVKLEDDPEFQDAYDIYFDVNENVEEVQKLMLERRMKNHV